MKNLNLLLSFILFAVAANLSAQVPFFFDPPEVEATLGFNDSAMVHTLLKNASNDTVEFSFPAYTSRDQGGPDSFGYSWIDSDGNGGPNYEWNDITENGYMINGLHDDNVAGPFEMDIDFPFYGQTKTSFWISSNGCIQFNDRLLPFANSSIPTNSNSTDFIAWFWDDLTIDTAITSVYFKNFADKTIVQFNRMVHYPGTESFITAQVVMMNNGTIIIRYKMVSDGFVTNNATVGLQSGDPLLGLQVAFNEAYIHSEMAVRFNLNRNFITSVSPASGFLAPGAQETIRVFYSSAGFEPGSYEQELGCNTNLVEIPQIYLHNVMHVTNPDQAGFRGYITDASTGYAINDVNVQAGEHHVFTNSNGYYELPLEPGNYTISFSRNGYQTRVVEDTTAVAGYSTLDITLGGFYFIAGRVYAGDNPIESGFAYSYKMLEGTVVDIYAEMVGVEGWFEFSGLSAAQYIVKAEPSPTSVYYGNYLPTYYGDVIHWEEATTINLNQGINDAHINLVALTNGPQGAGMVNGSIENGGKSAGIPVVLQTLDKSVVVMAYSATDGTFSFSGLAFGAYEIFAEIPGKSVVPQTIILDETTPVADGIKMIILENEIVFLGIIESEVFVSTPVIYPNPVDEKINIKFNLKKPALISITVSDPAGRIVSAGNYSITGQKNITIGVKSLPRGIYFLRFESQGESIMKKIVKE